MRSWTRRTLAALLVGVVAPALATAQPTTPPVTTPATPPAAAQPGNALPLPATTPGSTVVAPGGVIYQDPYQAATPYNPTVIGQPHPNSAFNRPNMTLPCNIPNQNLSPYEPRKPGCFKKNVWGNAWDNCGCQVGTNTGCNESKHPALVGMTHPFAGFASKGGACTTCANTLNFGLNGSRGFFGESSREFFERPPSTDGVKLLPRKYNLPQAPAAFIPSDMMVTQPYPQTGVARTQYVNPVVAQQP